jgi:signal peptidase II
MLSRKLRVFVPVFLLLVLADCGTKRMAETHLVATIPQSVFGDALRFTLAYNPDAAFGVSVGPASRWVLAIAAAVVLVLLIGMLRRARSGDTWLVAALALAAGGATGNLLDRVYSSHGVVDFIDVGLGAHRFWTFNVADVGVTTGALLLAVLLWRRGTREASVVLGNSDPEH